MASKNRQPVFLFAFCWCLFATFSTSRGYKIEPKMSCKLSGVPMFVAEIPVDADNRDALFVDDPARAEKAFVVNENGTRCDSSNATVDTVNGIEILRIWAPLDCGATEVHDHNII